MKRVYVNEKWCLGCHLCEYHCAFSNMGGTSMARSLMGVKINPRIRIEESDSINFAVSCRHCEDAICVKSCITGALSVEDGVIKIDKEKCIGCQTCILVCPYGAISPSENGVMQKCELCLQNDGKPKCVENCPNNAIVFEER